MIAFRIATETDFTTATNQWAVPLPNIARPGDYMLMMLASPQAGVLWSSPGWEQLDGFSTVQFTLGGLAQSPLAVPLSYGLFAKFLDPNDSVDGTYPPVFSISGPPTSVIGATPASAAGVALCAAYGGVSRAQSTRFRALSQLPPIAISFNPTQQESLPVYNPLVAAGVPAIFAEANDWLVTPLITPGTAINVSLPSVNFNLRASTTGGNGIVIGLADEIVGVSGLQTGLIWTASSMPTPLITEAVALWPDASNLDQQIVLYATLDRNPAHFDYEYSQEPTVVANSVGYVFKIYAGPREAPRAIFNSAMLNTATLLLTRPDGSTENFGLTFGPDGRYAYAVSLNDTFPYTGVYYLQLQIKWANGAVQYSSQCYLTVRPQGGV